MTEAPFSSLRSPPLTLPSLSVLARVEPPLPVLSVGPSSRRAERDTEKPLSLPATSSLRSLRVRSDLNAANTLAA